MLNKELCHKCWLETASKWEEKPDDLWKEKRFKHEWNIRALSSCCIATSESPDSTITYEKPPENCPYLLEHLLSKRIYLDNGGYI